MLIDRSGSMSNVAKDHTGNIQNLVKEQQKLDEEATFTLIQFDGQAPNDVVFDNLNLKDVDIDSYELYARGSTPLNQALGATIARIEEQEKKNKSDKVVFFIVTDGGNTDGSEWTQAQLKEKIEKYKDDWVIIFLGANIDAFSGGGNYGINVGHTMSFAQNGASVTGAYQLTSGKLFASRKMARGQEAQFAANMCYTEQDYTTQDEWVDNSVGKTNARASESKS